MEKDTGSFEDIARNKLAQAIDDLESADILLGADKYRAANNRAYYAVFHAIDAVLSMEPVAFKKHKDVIAYFNKNQCLKYIFYVVKRIAAGSHPEPVAMYYENSEM